jgi:Protein of unknown function (DUF1573)
MKLIVKNVGMMLVAATVLMACNNKDAEKKIATLEARLSELEGKKSPSAITPVETPAAETKPEGPLPIMQLETTEHDFGTIKEGDVVEYVYKIKNTGEAPLIIQSAQPSCGCTVPDWSKEPIPVNGEGFVKAKFDSKGKPNAQNKTITVTANTWPKQTKLSFKAMVLPNPTTEGPAK